MQRNKDYKSFWTNLKTVSKKLEFKSSFFSTSFRPVRDWTSKRGSKVGVKTLLYNSIKTQLLNGKSRAKLHFNLSLCLLGFVLRSIRWNPTTFFASVWRNLGSFHGSGSTIHWFPIFMDIAQTLHIWQTLLTNIETRLV